MKSRFKVMKLEERIAPAILTTSTTDTKSTKHPGPTDTVTTTVESTNPAGHNPPGQPNYTLTTSTELANRLANSPRLTHPGRALCPSRVVCVSVPPRLSESSHFASRPAQVQHRRKKRPAVCSPPDHNLKFR